MEDWWDDTEQGKWKYSVTKHITVLHFYHKFHTEWNGIDPGLL